MEAIADGLADAYELGQSSRKVDFDVAKLQEHWYYLSPRGIEYVKSHPLGELGGG
jgi:hypothetical protein